MIFIQVYYQNHNTILLDLFSLQLWANNTLLEKNLIVSERLSDKTIKKYRCGTMRVVIFCIDIQINIQDTLPDVLDDMLTREKKSRALEQVMCVFASWLVVDEGLQVTTATDYVQDCLAVFAEQLNMNVKAHG